MSPALKSVSSARVAVPAVMISPCIPRGTNLGLLLDPD
jgi:hypothetical protein